MSYIIEQNIKGRIYLYRVDSYWDKDKKQARQKRTYIGPKNSKNKKSLKDIPSSIIHKNYGNIFFLNFFIDKLGLKNILTECFPEYYNEMLALALYEISEGNPLYLFPYWIDENYLPDVKRLDSSAISKFCELIGRNQKSMMDFQQAWMDQLQPINALYYDITSISSYSTNIDLVEWGYNRDGEELAQINLGVVFCNKRALPIFYTTFPGSIVDVRTLLNCAKYLKGMGLKDFMFILDRGFFSTENIYHISTDPIKISFIQPLPFSLKKVKQLIKTHKKELTRLEANFLFNDELLSHVKTEIQLGEHTFPAHIFLNGKAELDQKQMFIKKLIEIEQKLIRNRKFENQKDAIKFKENNIPKTYQEYFKFSRQTRTLQRNHQQIKEKIANLGYFVLSTNNANLEKEEILAKYRNRDQVEKVFDLLKNEMDGNRLRAHNQYNTDARLFIKFIALIIESEIVRIMKESKLFKKYTVKELLSELKKIKYTVINDEIIISEVSKKNREILETFGIDLNDLHRY